MRVLVYEVSKDSDTEVIILKYVGSALREEATLLLAHRGKELELVETQEETPEWGGIVTLAGQRLVGVWRNENKGPFSFERELDKRYAPQHVVLT